MSRQHETDIDIHAPVEAVWRALADPDELARWFVESARIEPREGGAYWRNWGDNITAEMRIATWQPERHLRLINQPDRPEAEDVPEQVWHLSRDPDPMVEDYILEAHGATTRLRVVQSNMPDSPEWDGFVQGTKRGWEIALTVLRHYLEHHRGQERHITDLKLRTPLPQEAAWQRATDTLGLAVGNGSDGERFTTTAPDGTQLEGTILKVVPRFGILASVSSKDDALLAIRTQSTSTDTMVWVSLTTFDATPALSPVQAHTWRQALETALAA